MQEICLVKHIPNSDMCTVIMESRILYLLCKFISLCSCLLMPGLLSSAETKHTTVDFVKVESALITMRLKWTQFLCPDIIPVFLVGGRLA